MSSSSSSLNLSKSSTNGNGGGFAGFHDMLSTKLKTLANAQDDCEESEHPNLNPDFDSSHGDDGNRTPPPPPHDETPKMCPQDDPVSVSAVSSSDNVNSRAAVPVPNINLDANGQISMDASQLLNLVQVMANMQKVQSVQQPTVTPQVDPNLLNTLTGLLRAQQQQQQGGVSAVTPQQQAQQMPAPAPQSQMSQAQSGPSHSSDNVLFKALMSNTASGTLSGAQTPLTGGNGERGLVGGTGGGFLTPSANTITNGASNQVSSHRSYKGYDADVQKQINAMSLAMSVAPSAFATPQASPKTQMKRDLEVQTAALRDLQVLTAPQTACASLAPSRLPSRGPSVVLNDDQVAFNNLLETKEGLATKVNNLSMETMNQLTSGTQTPTLKSMQNANANNSTQDLQNALMTLMNGGNKSLATPGIQTPTGMQTPGGIFGSALPSAIPSRQGSPLLKAIQQQNPQLPQLPPGLSLPGSRIASRSGSMTFPDMNNHLTAGYGGFFAHQHQMGNPMLGMMGMPMGMGMGMPMTMPIPGVHNYPTGNNMYSSVPAYAGETNPSSLDLTSSKHESVTALGQTQIEEYPAASGTGGTEQGHDQSQHDAFYQNYDLYMNPNSYYDPNYAYAALNMNYPHYGAGNNKGHGKGFMNARDEKKKDMARNFYARRKAKKEAQQAAAAAAAEAAGGAGSGSGAGAEGQ